MSILIDKATRVLVQGITGRTGRTQTKWMLNYGTNIVAGVTPGKGGEVVEGIPYLILLRKLLLRPVRRHQYFLYHRLP